MRTPPFPIRHWLLTMAIGPFGLLIWDATSPDFNAVLSPIAFYFMLLFFGCLFSLPVLVVHYALYRILLGRNVSETAIRILLITWALFAEIGMLSLIGGSLTDAVIISYGCALIATGAVLKVES